MRILKDSVVPVLG